MNADKYVAKPGSLMLLAFIAGVSLIGTAQVSSTGSSWTTTTQQADPSGTVHVNPIRSRIEHIEVDGRIIEKTVLETVGPDGRYVPYLEIERESVRVNDTTVRNIERSFGRDVNGQRSLTQETQEVARTFPDGAKTVTRTTSNPDANGALQVVQRAIVDSKQVGHGVRQTNTTVYSADGSGGLGPTVEIEERERQTDATTTEFRKSTSLADGAGHWRLSEVREGTTRQETGGTYTREETVQRPDASGKMVVAERTVNKESAGGPGQRNDTMENYSTDVPGRAGNDGLQLVRRETTVQQISENGARGTTTRVEEPNPGDPGAGLHVTQETIDIVRPAANDTAGETRTILTPGSNGRLDAVWVDMEKTNNSAVVKVDIAPPN